TGEFVAAPHPAIRPPSPQKKMPGDPIDNDFFLKHHSQREAFTSSTIMSHPPVSIHCNLVWFEFRNSS
ncbi:MAG: hypothetical protein VW876_17260, partial [Deltaproteobacteria bacterium]